MSKEAAVRYYLIKDIDLIYLFKELIDISNSMKEDIDCFIETYAPEAKLYSLKTAGNLQLRYISFQWIFPSIKHIPDSTYTNFEYLDSGVVASPNINTNKGLKLREEQMELLNVGTADGYEIWHEELVPLLRWELAEEPGLIYNDKKHVYILVTDKFKPHGSKPEYFPPNGVVRISKTKVDELLPHIN